jgi:DNA-binding NarL/FixJ family response regulator
LNRQRILLVDDQQLVLLGLERMLRRMRGVLEVTVADSGRKACAILEEQAFDVVVTDLNMPGFSGTQLLEWVLGHQPAMVRIVLSGHQDKRMLHGSAHLAHRFLTKPCEPGVLAEVLLQVSELQELPPHLKRAVAGTDRLPSSPVACHRIRACAENREAPVLALRDLALGDPGMAAKALQLLNSGVFGAPRRVADPWEAVQALTREELVDLEAEPVPPDQEARLKPLREAGLRTARAARAITRAEGAPPAVQALAWPAPPDSSPRWVPCCSPWPPRPRNLRVPTCPCCPGIISISWAFRPTFWTWWGAIGTRPVPRTREASPWPRSTSPRPEPDTFRRKPFWPIMDGCRASRRGGAFRFPPRMKNEPQGPAGR